MYVNVCVPKSGRGVVLKSDVYKCSDPLKHVAHAAKRQIFFKNDTDHCNQDFLRTNKNVDQESRNQDSPVQGRERAKTIKSTLHHVHVRSFGRADAVRAHQPRQRAIRPAKDRVPRVGRQRGPHAAVNCRNENEVGRGEHSWNHKKRSMTDPNDDERAKISRQTLKTF